MQGLYFDGRTARPHTVTVADVGGQIAGEGEGASFLWPTKRVRLLDVDAGKARLAAPDGDGRLILDLADWETLGGPVAAVRREAGRRELRLIGWLTAAGVAVALGVFVGIPAASGPLARATPPDLETRMGDNMAGQIKLAMRSCEGDVFGRARLEEMTQRLARHSDMPFEIKISAVRAPMVNAFALPGGSILVTDDLIQMARSPDELAAVIAHEIAHVERRHAMQAAWQSMGVGLVLDAVVGGGTGAGQQAVLLVGGFTEQRFSRELELEADARAIELLKAEGISTRGMADFFDRLADHRSPREAKDVAEWFSTHPDTERRAHAARALATEGRPALSAADWAAVKRVCRQQGKPKIFDPLS